MAQEIPNQTGRGYAYALAAFGGWGFIALYFKVIEHVPIMEIIAHRVVWMAIMLLGATLVMGRMSVLRRYLFDPKIAPLMFITAILISTNWLCFTYAVLNDRVMDTSLGYFINPLFNVVLGMLFLKEQLRPFQRLSILIATVGVGYMIIQHGSLPWIALYLPLSFGLYGLLRKRIPVDALSGLTMEVIMLAPFGLAYMVWLHSQGAFHFVQAPTTEQVIIAACGIVTLTPLMCFGASVKRISYTSVGIMQYITPSTSFLLSIFVFGEAFTQAKLITFACIWTSVILFAAESILYERRKLRRLELQPEG